MSKDRPDPALEIERLPDRHAALHAWYSRIGYAPVHAGTIDEAYPQLPPLLATPCDFVIYHKRL